MTPAGATIHRDRRLLVAAIVLATALAYAPAFRAGFVWDDDAHVIAGTDFAGADGLRRLWLEPGATQQYYPVVYTSFWLEQFVWGDSPAGYHAVNVALHAVNACLLGWLLAALGVPGAWLAAALFALHPVHVESVAWISERKNVLSTCFYLLALLAYLRFAGVSGQGGAGRRSAYAASFVLFLLAALSKTVVVTLPAAVLLILWWKRGRIGRADVGPLLPFFAAGAALGGITLWIEKSSVGAFGAPFELGAFERVLLAARAPWFYLGKLAWPADLAFVYPRWTIDAGDPLQLGALAATVAALAGLWAARHRIGRGPLAAALFFGGTLVPALGFFDVYPFLFSYVADHFQYLASAGPIALAAAALAAVAARFSDHRAAGLACAAAAAVWLAALGGLTFAQARTYRDAPTLWRATLERNPDAWLAHHNLGVHLFAAGEEALGMAAYDRAIALRPEYAGALNNRGTAYLDRGDYERAIEDFTRAIEAQPDHVLAITNRGAAYRRLGRFDRMLADFARVAELAPEDPSARLNLGNAYRANGMPERAVAAYDRAIDVLPDYAPARVWRCEALRELGRLEEALRDCERAVALAPTDADALLARASIYEALGRPDRARADREEARRQSSSTIP